jgi:hypothetical protein
MQSLWIHMQQSVGWGTFIAVAVTPPPAAIASIIVTNLCFQVLNTSLLLCFNQLLEYTKLWIVLYYDIMILY